MELGPELSVTSFPCPQRKFLPLRKGILLCAPETSFLFPPCPDRAGEKEEPSCPALSPLENFILFNKTLGCHLGTFTAAPERSQIEQRGRWGRVSTSGLFFFLFSRRILELQRILVFCGCSCWALLVLAPPAGCLFHTGVTPGKSYGSARKKLPQQHQVLGAKQTRQAERLGVFMW